MIGIQCFLFLIPCTFSAMSDYSVPKLDSEVQYLIVVKNSSLTKHLIRKLESYNWTLPAIATLDKWMSKHWIDPINREQVWSSSGLNLGRKEVRDAVKKLLYKFKAKKNYINYLCSTAIEEGIFNKADTEKIRNNYWKLQYKYTYPNTQSMLFSPYSTEYYNQNIDPEGLVKLKAISDKYLEDTKQEQLLKWNYYKYYYYTYEYYYS
ncbi:DUF4294 domain-containing protein [Caenorhabditis elegans]|uniref:DUF4294 domain-containing protein n=1 Tax=Caenorhabditis elegans TaxID=6239 RepID=Q9XXT4_CAEEL|nr:DUF4294 domain-containing protein [Caenorhabditis elegans]CAA16165.2 DUF4294 domain-containing protein [Caenorhabditis elegans]|eukprot:NP_507170.2 Uncharacterized protein CELE_F57E7.2 [Caenorhabditis elegans]